MEAICPRQWLFFGNIPGLGKPCQADFEERRGRAGTGSKLEGFRKNAPLTGRASEAYLGGANPAVKACRQKIKDDSDLAPEGAERRRPGVL